MSEKKNAEIASDILVAALQAGAIKTFTDKHAESARRIGEAYGVILNAVRHAEREPIRSPGSAG